MKFIISAILACFLFSSFSLGQNIRNIRISFNKEDFAIVENGVGQMVVQSEKSNVMFKSDTLSPAIPYIGINVVVSQSEEYASVTLSGDDVVVGEDIMLAANPKYVFSNSTKKNIGVIDTISYKKTVYPNKSVEYVGCGKMRGYKILSFRVSPFRYDARNKRLFFKNNIVLHLKTNGNKTKGISNCFEEMVRRLVVNGDEIKTLYPTSSVKNIIPDYYEYLIITSESLKPTFQKLANWKTQKGVPTNVLTTAEIAVGFTGSTLQEKIKNALKYYYDNSSGMFTYALLGGDVDIVPTQICYAAYNGDARNMPTDLYYACFDIMDWDLNGNGVYGEIYDKSDILPEIYVSRASVSNVLEAETFVDRVISYESNPLWTNNAKKILMAGTKRDIEFVSNLGYMGIASDSQVHSYYLYKWYVEPYWDGDKVEFYDTHTNFPGDGNYDFSATHLQDKLENGYGFVHIMTHGNPWLWKMEPANDYYTIYNASSQDNQGETIILTSTCLTNAFDSVSTCLSESFMRNPDSGVLAYVGCSREGFGTTDILNIGPSNIIDGLIMKNIFNLKDNNFARCVIDGKCACIACCYDYDNPYRWLLFGINPMGDPEMPIYTTIPQVFDNVEMAYGINGHYIHTNIDSCRICIMGRDNTTYLCSYNVSSINGYTLSDGEYNICITKNGYIPYNRIFGINQGVYIQNESFNANIDIVNPDVYIGSDVKPSTLQGPVTIHERSSVKICASNGVFIKNDFEVKTGATFEITQ
ncbi:MAG: hypothetical protein J5805_07070 [Bacteroidaceae bacterium]|nr:hypothetical protein [Bacteroidaceae bacterium]